MQKDVKEAAEDSSELELHIHDGYGDMTHTKPFKTIVASSAASSPVPATPATNTPNNSVVPTPATSPRALLPNAKISAKWRLVFQKVMTTLQVPQPKHIRARSAPEVVSAAASACAPKTQS
jgi:hypothetical protein